MHRTVVKFNTLADSDGTGSEHQHFAPVGSPDFIFLCVRRVIIRRYRLEFGSAGIHHFVAGYDVPAFAPAADFRLRSQCQFGDGTVRQAAPFGGSHQLRRHRFLHDALFHGHNTPDFVNKKRINGRDARDIRWIHLAAQRFGHDEQPLVIPLGKPLINQLIRQCGNSRQLQAMSLDLQRPDGFQQSRFESPVDGHHFAGRLHLGSQLTIGADKFIKRPPREFQHNVVQ